MSLSAFADGGLRPGYELLLTRYTEEELEGLSEEELQALLSELQAEMNASKSAAKQETPAEKETPVEKESAEKDEVLSEEKTPVEEEASEEKTSDEEESSVEEETTPEEEAPEEENPVEGETPTEEEESGKGEASGEEEPGEGETPEEENPTQDEAPNEEEESGEEEASEEDETGEEVASDEEELLATILDDEPTEIDLSEPEMGTLHITKTDVPPPPVYSLAQSAGETDNTKFSFKVTLSAEDETSLPETYEVNIAGNASTMHAPDGVITLELGFGESAEIALPYGTHYEVEETTQDADYSTYWYTNPSGTIDENTPSVWLTCVNQLNMGKLRIEKAHTPPKPEPKPEPKVYSFNPNEPNAGARFTFTVKLSGRHPRDAYAVSINGSTSMMDAPGGVITLELGFGESAEIALPYGTHYEVVEEPDEDYETSWWRGSSSIESAEGVIDEQSPHVMLSCVNTLAMGVLSILKLSELPPPVPVYSLTPANEEAVEKFIFTVKLSRADGKALRGSYYVNFNNAQRWEEKALEGDHLTIELGFTDQVMIALPFGTSYEVTEARYNDYETSWYGSFVNGTIDGNNPSAAITCVNKAIPEGMLRIEKVHTPPKPEPKPEPKVYSFNPNEPNLGARFTFKVTLSRQDGRPLREAYAVSINGEEPVMMEAPGGVITLELSFDESAEIILPYGTHYKVVEEPDEDYETSWWRGSSSIESAEGDIDEQSSHVTLSCVNTPAMGVLSILKLSELPPPVPVYSLTPASEEAVKKFTFTVKLSRADGKALRGSYYVSYNNAQQWEEKALEGDHLTIELGFTDQVMIALPFGTSYEVTEAQYGDYETSWYGSSVNGTIDENNTSAAITCVNEPIPEGTLVIGKLSEPPRPQPTPPVYALDPTARQSDSVKFTFTVKLSRQDGRPLCDAYDVNFNNTQWEAWAIEGNRLTFELGFNEWVQISLPYGTSYTVEEARSFDYVASWWRDTSSIESASGVIDGNDAYVEISCVNVPAPTGDLTVSKTVTGNPDDPAQSFEFTVTLKDGNAVARGIDKKFDTEDGAGKAGTITFTKGVAKFTLKGGESLTIKGLPAGLTYEVVETPNADYDVTPDTGKITGTIVAGANAKAPFTNRYNAPEPTPTPTPTPAPALSPDPTPEPTSIAGKKTWDDNDNAGGTRPASIVVWLLRNGERFKEKTVTETDGWAYRFDDLPVRDANGKAYVYTISEQLVHGYYAQVDGTDLINTLLPTVPDDPTPPRFTEQRLTEEELANYISLFGYDTPLWGQLLQTGDELPVYPFIFAGAGGIALLVLLVSEIKKRKGRR